MRLDGILQLIREASKEQPLTDTLTNLCKYVAEIASCQVVSIYVREVDARGGEVLVMRGNVGLEPAAVNQVRLRVGEGMTGFAAQCLRPISAAVGAEDEHYKAVRGIGEERFPAFLAVPVLRVGTSAAVLVLQRARPSFRSEEVALATALASSFSHALERARDEGAGLARHPGTTGRVRLVGSRLQCGLAMGALRALPSLDEALRGASVAERREPGAAVRRELARLTRMLSVIGGDAAEHGLRNLQLLVEDQRLLATVESRCRCGGIERGLKEVASEYARAAENASYTAERWMHRRASEVEDLCRLVAMRLQGGRHRAGGVLVLSGAISGMTALAARTLEVRAVVFAGPPEMSMPAQALLKDIPSVAEVGGIFSWTRWGDCVVVDGCNGSVCVHPSVLEKKRARRAAGACAAPACPSSI